MSTFPLFVYFFGAGFRLWTMWAWTNVLAASAASRLSSPAIVAAATTVASFLALAPGVEPPPLHPTRLAVLNPHPYILPSWPF